MSSCNKLIFISLLGNKLLYYSLFTTSGILCKQTFYSVFVLIWRGVAVFFLWVLSIWFFVFNHMIYTRNMLGLGVRVLGLGSTSSVFYLVLDWKAFWKYLGEQCSHLCAFKASYLLTNRLLVTLVVIMATKVALRWSASRYVSLWVYNISNHLHGQLVVVWILWTQLKQAFDCVWHG